MTEWYEKAYPGAPPPGGLIPLPRPLYPPDANQQGKKPSVNGVDVEAIKRGISRGGRWPWQNFDQAFSNAFAHGNSPNVSGTGLAGFQRQMDIDDTGWYGEKTHNALQYALIPEGLPHAGEHLLDDLARKWLSEAYERFGGHEPASAGAAARARLQKAISQIGVKESPPNSNRVKYTDWYGMVGPWCAMFVTWCDQMSEADTASFVQGSYYAYVPYIVQDARNGRRGLRTTDDPDPGDLVCYDWQWNGEYDHVGIFEEWVPGSGEFHAIEGNTSTSNDSNGGQVMRRTRSRYEQATVFVRVAE